jgi:uncharacterized protein (TIGR03083 family)
VTDEELHAALEEAIARVLTVSADALDRPVDACPGWSVADLLGHLTAVHRWAAQIVATRASERIRREPSTPPDGAALLDHVAEGARQLQAVLRAADLDEIVWTFAGPRPARWWLRRQVHETAVHAWDATAAAGAAAPVPAAVAVDGLDEHLDMFVPRLFDTAAFAGTGETMHLHATDCDGEWLVRFDPDAVVVTREHQKGDVAARGTASDLLLVVWNRVGTEALEVFGDASVLDRFRAAARF